MKKRIIIETARGGAISALMLCLDAKSDIRIGATDHAVSSLDLAIGLLESIGAALDGEAGKKELALVLLAQEAAHTVGVSPEFPAKRRPSDSKDVVPRVLGAPTQERKPIPPAKLRKVADVAGKGDVAGRGPAKRMRRASAVPVSGASAKPRSAGD